MILMGNRTFHFVVGLLWLVTMAWLLVSKVLPPLWRGNPPSLRSTLPSAEEPICWDLSWNDQTVGWAGTQVLPGSGGSRNLHHRLVLRQFPVDQFAPAMISSLVRQSVGRVDLDAKTRIEIDSIGALVGFHATIQLAELEHALSMSGVVEGERLRVSVRFADLVEPEEMWVPLGAFISSELAPRAEMPDLFVGRRWTEEVFSPLRRPGSPLEVLLVEVVDEAWIQFDGERVKTHEVVYRNDSGSGLRSLAEIRGRVWVALDGRVLQQELAFLKTTFLMVRMSPAAGRRHLEEQAADWLSDPALAP